MKMTHAVLAAVLCLATSLASAQSLVEAAAAEAARRGTTLPATRALTNADLPSSATPEGRARTGPAGGHSFVSGPELPPDPAGDGRWRVSTDVNPLNDRPIVTAILPADGPVQGW